MNFTRRDKTCNRPIDVHFDPTNLVLPRCPITKDRVAMTIDQTWCNSTAGRINRAISVALFKAMDDAIFNQKSVAIGNGFIQIP
jgi:hypothetical protein